jgi:hypothetical protein
VEGNHKQRKQQSNLPLFNIKMTTKRNWDNYWFTFRRELHIYSPRARLSPYL